MFGKKRKQHNTKISDIKWRGQEVLRLEGFSDAVFAFAMTLLVVSLEVPKTFEELIMGIKGFIGFGICFSFLFIIWHQQYTFFRQYYLKDIWTIVLNAMLLFVVLCYVYPLKFLFALFIDGNEVEENGKIINRVSSNEQVRELFIIYGSGFMMVYLVFALLYCNALRQKEFLKLSRLETFHTKTEIYQQLLMIFVGALSVVSAIILSDYQLGISGMVYILISPLLFLFFNIRKRKMKKLFSEEEFEAHLSWLKE